MTHHELLGTNESQLTTQSSLFVTELINTLLQILGNHRTISPYSNNYKLSGLNIKPAVY